MTENRRDPQSFEAPEDRGETKNLEDQSAERMLERYRQGLLTKGGLDDYLELQRHRSELQEKALEAGRRPGRALEEE
ncbi:MAG: hypothetical protein ACYC66_04445 [Chloroflexota bacterium]